MHGRDLPDDALALLQQLAEGFDEAVRYRQGSLSSMLHGFPYDAHAYEDVAERLAAAGRRCIIPFLRRYAPTRFLPEETGRSGQQAALGFELLALMDALEIETACLPVTAGAGVRHALWPCCCRNGCVD